MSPPVDVERALPARDRPAPLNSSPSSSNQALHLPTHIITPPGGWVPIRVRELWEYRELLYFFIWRELKIRYKQTALGVSWAIIQPLFTMIVFSVIFGRLAKLPSDGLPYPVFAYCALLPWQLFAFAMTEASNSVVANRQLLTKVYFPRLLMPLAAVAVGLADFAVSFVILLAMIAFYGITPALTIWTIPLWTLLAVVTALGVGLWLSALNVRYRDIRYTLPFLTQIWMFATPIAYASSIIPAAWRPYYALNPMVGVVEGFRWALVGGAAAPAQTVAISVAAVTVLLVSGLFYFRRTESTFADII
jgi:lipopolysaccharide transport system permease protein